MIVNIWSSFSWCSADKLRQTSKAPSSSQRRRSAELKVSISVFHRVDRGCDVSGNLSHAVICQVTGVAVGGNHGGRVINSRSSAGRVVHTSAADRGASATRVNGLFGSPSADMI